MKVMTRGFRHESFRVYNVCCIGHPRRTQARRQFRISKFPRRLKIEKKFTFLPSWNIASNFYLILAMAELEVIKHSKKIYGVLKSDEPSWWHKLKEFLLEILIIVFAVSITIWFHDLSEKRHKRHDVKEFLIGLKTDLQRDITEMESDRKSYLTTTKAFHYINRLGVREEPNLDSLNYGKWFFSEVEFAPNDGRFEGFKSSGRIGDIEDTELQNDIMDLYQENITALLSSTHFYSDRKVRLVDYMARNLRRETDSTTNMSAVLATDEARNICQNLFFTDEIIKRYDVCIAQSKKIITTIDRNYHE